MKFYENTASRMEILWFLNAICPSSPGFKEEIGFMHSWNLLVSFARLPRHTPASSYFNIDACADQ